MGLHHPAMFCRRLPSNPNYLVSRRGDVYSMERDVPSGPGGRRLRLKRGRWLKPIDNGRSLHVGCTTRNRRRNVGSLVLETYVGPRPTPAHQCCHIDGDYRNNDPSNLRWGLPKDNTADRDRHGTTARGVRQWQAKFTDIEIMDVRRLRSDGWKLVDLADKFGVSASTISRIVRRKMWAHVA